MTTTLDMTVREFARDLAAEQPTPGGGSAAALAGALAGSLVCMVCRYTLGRPRYEHVQEDARLVLDRAERIRNELEGSIAADVAAYQAFSDAQRLPKDTSEQQASRAAALQSGLRASTCVPLQVAQHAAELVALAHEASMIGNPNLISDAGVAASLASAVFEAAALNVRLNVSGIEDVAYAHATLERLRTITPEELRRLVDQTYEVIGARTG